MSFISERISYYLNSEGQRARQETWCYVVSLSFDIFSKSSSIFR